MAATEAKKGRTAKSAKKAAKKVQRKVGRKSKKEEFATYKQRETLKITDAAVLRDVLKSLNDDDLKKHATKVGADVTRAFSLKHHGLQRMNAINVIVHAQMTR